MSPLIKAPSRILVTHITMIVCFVAVSFNSNCTPWRGDAIETWETTNNSFKIRITVFDERGVWVGLAHSYYVFESASVNSDIWREFMMLRHDDRPKIPKDQVRFVNESIGYVFMEWMYGVTTDGGKSWSIWDLKGDMSDPHLSFGAIKDVRIERDGTGNDVTRVGSN